MEQYPKPRHQYIYTPRYGQRGILTYAGQQPNGAPPTGVMGGGYGYGFGVTGGYGYGMGLTGVGAAAVTCASGAYTRPVYPHYRSPFAYGYGSGFGYGYGTGCYPSYTFPYSGYYNSGLYGSMYPYANFYHPYQRAYYSTVPTYGYTQAYVYPPGPTTTTTTYHVTNGPAPAVTTEYRTSSANVVRETRPAYPHGHAREDLQTESRRIATDRGAYDARKIRPADARDDDPFWCREVNGEWHLRSYYQIENECHPGRWKMDAEVGFLMFERH